MTKKNADTPVTTVESLEAKLAVMRAAQREYGKFSQEDVDRIFRAAAMAANKARIPLAKLAVEVGLVVGMTAATRPMGSAIFLMP